MKGKVEGPLIRPAGIRHQGTNTKSSVVPAEITHSGLSQRDGNGYLPCGKHGKCQKLLHKSTD